MNNISPELIAIGISIVVYICSFAFFFGGLSQKVNNLEKRFDNMENNLEKRFEAVEKRFEGVEKRFEGVEKRFEAVERDVNDLKLKVYAMDTDLSWIKKSIAIAGHSPLQRTPAGEQIFKELKGEEFVNSNYNSLKEFVGIDKDEYAIQERSFEAIGNVLPEDRIKSFRKYAYDNGWKVEDIYQAFGLYLRDKIFEEKNRTSNSF